MVLDDGYGRLMGDGERRCVYTVLLGGYEHLLEQPVARQSGTDFICFTDHVDPATTTWQVRPVPLVLGSDPGRSSRRPKLLVHEYLADYDTSLYIDNNVLLLADPDEIIDALLPHDGVFAALSHSFRETVRDEFEAVVHLELEAPWVCAEQLAHYEAVDPGALDARPLWGGLLLRRHNVPIVQQTMRLWWEHVLRYSRRDQLSLHAAARATGLDIVVHDLDNHLSPYHEWPRHAKRDRGATTPLPAGPERELAEARSRLEDASTEIAALHQQLEQAGALTRELEDARAEIKELLARLSDAEGRIDALHRSSSWRVTRPLRWASERVGWAGRQR